MNYLILNDLKRMFYSEIKSPKYFEGIGGDFLNGSYIFPSEHSLVRTNLLGGHSHEKIDEIFLKEKAIDFLTSQEQFKSLINNGTFNPYNYYQLSEYFVRTEAINELGVIYTFKENPKLKKNIVYVGNKGSGKTALQNIWLNENNSELEKKNIFWVRCDGHKLYQLWLGFKEHLNEGSEEVAELDPQSVKRLVNIEEYLDIQLLYVFSRYCMGEKRDFFEKILKKMELDKPTVAYPISRKNRTTKKCFLYDCITELRNTILKEEADEGEAYSYAYESVMKTSLDSAQLEKRRWISISKSLQNYFSVNDIWLLRIVDGVDNIHINEKSSEPYYMHMIREAHKFVRGRPKDKSIHFMALRKKTLIDITVNHHIQLDTQDYLEQFEIKHTPACFKEIITKRYLFFKDKYFKTDGLYDKVALAVINSVSPDIEDQSHNNAREFLHNKLTLISQVYYRIEQLNTSNFNISSHVNTLRSRNRYLNGRLFLNTKTQWGDLNTEPGVCCMNLFYFDIDKYPCAEPSHWYGLSKTRILQMLKITRYISEKLIIKYLSEVLNYPKELVLEDIQHLREFGMIDSKYYDKEVSYVISHKGRWYLDHVYSDIDTLYYFALDSALPIRFIDEGLIVGHNNSLLHTKTFYPSAAITTVMSFAFFLLRKNMLEEEDRKGYLGSIYDYLGELELPFSDEKISARLLISAKRLVRSMDNTDIDKVKKILEKRVCTP